MKKYKNKPWTERERRLLLTNYNHVDITKLIEWLPGRTRGAITNQAWQLRKKGLNFK